jgi:hypothetical protein
VNAINDALAPFGASVVTQSSRQRKFCYLLAYFGNTSRVASGRYKGAWRTRSRRRPHGAKLRKDLQQSFGLQIGMGAEIRQHRKSEIIKGGFMQGFAVVRCKRALEWQMLALPGPTRDLQYLRLGSSAP